MGEQKKKVMVEHLDISIKKLYDSIWCQPQLKPDVW